MKPLAERMRPTNLKDYAGQQHLIGEGSLLYQSIRSGKLPSLIFWGPPGVGKTTLALVIAAELKRPYHLLSAISSGVKDVREVIEKAKRQHFFDSPSPLLFIDEIHRFSKSQQDALLGAVEQGVITLIGATTENPSFEVIPALLSRCQVYTLEPLSLSVLQHLVETALLKDEYLNKKRIQVLEWEALLLYSGGDARKLYNLVEILADQIGESEELALTNDRVRQIAENNLLRYDKSGEQHYDMSSALIKSIRGSDPNAAVYWLARMLEGGEDPKFIARRLVIAAAEDIGLANPNALLMANTAFDAVSKIGMPEARIILSQATIYLATSTKSNSAYLAINKAQEVVRNTGNLPVPLHLRNAPTRLMEELGYGSNYKYAHDYPENFVLQEFFPEGIPRQDLYQPGNNPAEEKIKQWMEGKWGKKA
ncbi:MAG: replication-associated recombination protein A [Saprospiraceae bacterium]|nr:replication-associated recombination protein A [Saprospiraceae bacterium]